MAPPWPDPDLKQAAYVSPQAVVLGAVRLGAGASVWPGAVLRGDLERITVGARSNVQDGAIIHCDPGQPTVLEDEVTVGHRAVIHSAYVETGCLIGIGAILLDGVRVGRGSIIGAGAVVTRDVPPQSLAVGVPAKILRQLSTEEAQGLRDHAQKYHLLALVHGGKGQDLGFVEHPPQLEEA
jgi:carbonic anhydrase/acetyltransferase-like protein (isoleucine patch superfamily)